MARLSSYSKDTSITSEDKLIGSNYGGLDNQGRPIFTTANYKISDLLTYFQNNISVDGVNLSGINTFQLNLANSLGNYSNNGTLSSLSSAFVNLFATAEAGNKFATSTFQTNMETSVLTFDGSGNATVAEAFANQIFTTTTSDKFATSEYAQNIGSSFGTVASDGTVTLSEAFANSVMTTTSSDRFATSTYAQNLGSSIGTVDASGNITVSEAFANSVMNTETATDYASATSVTSLASTVSTKPDIFRQGGTDPGAPSTSNAVGSLWYDTDDNNKVYVLVAGDPNVWTLTDDSRIGSLVTSTASINQTLSTHTSDISANATFATGLASSFGTYDSETGEITALSTSFANAVMNTENTTDYAAASDVTELNTQFVFTNGEITGTSGAISTEIASAQSSATNAAASKVEDLAANFFTGYDAADGSYTATSLSADFKTAVNAEVDANSSTAGYVSNLSAAVGIDKTDGSTLQATAYINNGTAYTTTATVDGAVANSKEITITASNSNIEAGQYVTYSTQTSTTNRDVIFRVVSVSNITVVLDNDISLEDETVLTFTGKSTYNIDNLSGTIIDGFQVKGAGVTVGTYVVDYTSPVLTLSRAEVLVDDTFLEFLGVYAAVTETASVVANIDGSLQSTYGLQVDADGKIAGMKLFANNEGSEIAFTADSFKVYNGVNNYSPFKVENDTVYIKTVKFGDIENLPSYFVVTVVYADDASGTNASTTKGSKNYYGIFQGVDAWEDGDSVTGITFNQITGNAGTNGINAKVVKLTPSKHVINYNTDGTESDSITFTTEVQNITNSVTYRFDIVDNAGSVTTGTASATSTFTLDDADEPAEGEKTTVKVYVFENGTQVATDSVTIYAVKDGSSAVTGFLTNASHTCSADNDGGNPVLTGSGGDFQVFVGGTDVSSSCTFSVVSYTSGLTIAIDSSSGAYTITGLTVDTANAILKAVVPAATAGTAADVEITQTYSISKSIKGDTGLTGASGSNAKIIKLTPSKHVINYTESGSEVDTIDFTTSVQNIEGTATYRFYINGTAQGTGATTTSTFTLPDTNEPAAGGVTVVKVDVYDDLVLAASDSVSIYGVQDGSDAIVGFLTNAAHVVAASNNGTVSSFTGAGGTFSVFVGGANVTTSCTFSVSSEVGVDVSIGAANGIYTVNSMSADSGTAVFSAVIPAATAKTSGDITITSNYSISKSIKGDTGETGLTGAAGSDAKAIKLTPSRYTINYNENGDVADDTDISFTTEIQNVAGTATYRFYIDGVAQGTGATTTSTLDITDTGFPATGSSKVIKVNLYDGGTYVASDSVSIYGIQDGSDAIIGFLTNSAHVVAAANNGTVSSFSGAGGTFRVFVGGLEVTSSCTFDVDSESGVDVSINASSGAYTVSTMSADTGTATFSAVIPSATAKTSSDVTITADYSIAKSIKGNTGDTGPQGAAGADSKSVIISASPQHVVLYNGDNNKTAVAITLTATPVNLTSPQYRFLKDGVEKQAFSTTATYTIPDTEEPSSNTSNLWKVEAREGTGSTIAFDSLTVYGVKDGSNVYVAILSNESHVLPTTTAGAVTYTGSGTTIQVYKGNSLLNFTTGTPANNTFTVSKSGSNIAPGTESGSGTDTYTIGDHNTMDATNASITYTITAYGLSQTGTVEAKATIIKKQSFAKSQQGATGAQGIQGPDGADALRTVSGVLFWSVGQSTAPTKPIYSSGNPSGTEVVYTYSTGVFSGNGLDTNGGTVGVWQKASPQMAAGTAANDYWTVDYTILQADPSDTTATLSDGEIIFGTVTRSFAFNQVVTFSSLSTSGSTTINGDNITTGTITSGNYDAPDTGEIFADAGTRFNLSDGSIISKNFYINGSTGAAGFAGWTIDADSIKSAAISSVHNLQLYSTASNGLLVRDSEGTTSVQIKYGGLSTLTPTTTNGITFADVDNVEFGSFSGTVTSGAVSPTTPESLYKTTGTTYLTGSNLAAGSYTYDITVAAITSALATITGTAKATISLWIEFATDTAFANVIKSELLVSKNQTGAGTITFDETTKEISLSIDSTSSLYARFYWQRSYAVTSGSSIVFTARTFNISSADANNDLVFSKYKGRTEITNQGFQVINDPATYFKIDRTGYTSADPYVNIGGKLKVDGDVEVTGTINLSGEINNSDVTIDNLIERLGEINANTYLGNSTGVTFTLRDNLTILGDLTVNGNVSTVTSSQLFVTDPLIHLASGNETSNSVDIGFIGHYSIDAGVTKRHTGFFRDADNNEFYIFNGLVDASLDSETSPATTINRSGTGFSLASLNVATITASSIVKSGGTGSQFLKADGTTDPNTYLTASSTATLTNKSGNISQWTNNSGYITASSTATLTNKSGNISQWTNDSGYLTSQTSHDDVLVDGDFTSNGLMKRTAAGTYAIVTDNSANWDQVYTDYTAADVLTKIKTVDGAASGLDADLLDGLQASAFMKTTAVATLDMANYNITNANTVQIADPGPNEGIEWLNGSLWKIYESPNDLTTNSGGNLQIVQNATRRATFNTSGQLEIPVATGTSPLAVSSTTVVTNLNADLLDGQHASAFALAGHTHVLGTDTTGNYVAGLTAGQGIAVTGTAGEGWSPTVALQAVDLTLFPTSNFKKSVKVATTANITLSGTQTIDGVAVVVGDRVLVKDQSTASQNGIYKVNSTAWTRTVSADGSNEIDNAIVAVDQGTTNGGQYYTNTFKTTDTVGTTAMPWFRIPIDSAAYVYSFGISGNAAFATRLTSGNTINGVTFTGAAPITITANTPQTLTRGTYLTGSNFNGSSATTWAVDATSANTASKVVARDASGNFSAGTITAALSGNASTATAFSGNRTVNLTGQVTGSTTTWNGSTTLSINTTINTNYAAGLTAGQGITISGTAAAGWSPTVALQALDLTLFPTSNFKKSVKAATTGNITLSGTQTIDGIAIAANDRVLVKDQTSAAQNGIYRANTGAWVRTVSADGSSEIDNAIVAVDQGTTNGGQYFTNVFKTTDVVGTTVMPWFRIPIDSAAYNYSFGILGNAATASRFAGNGVNINGVAFNGTQNITISANTTNTLTRGSYLTGSNFNGSAATTWAVDATNANTASKVVARDASGNFSAGTITASLSGNASTATAFSGTRTVTLTGDVTGSTTTWTGSGALSIATTIAANSVALGTDTTGNYVGNITAGTGISVGGSAGEGTSRSVGLLAADLTLFPTSNFKKSVKAATTANITLSALQTIDGISCIAGDRVLVKNQTTASQNGIYIVNAATWTRSTAADGSTEIDNAIVAVDQGATNGGYYFTNMFKTTDTVGTTSMPWYRVMHENGTWGISITGNAATATTLQTARTINGVSFNGSANITVTANTSQTLTRGSYLTGSNFNGGTATTWAVDATSTNTASKVVARDASGNFTAGIVSASLNGNASTATTLQTARTIALSGAATGTATSFNGSANITIPVTALNASNLSAGTVPDARLTGLYTGITMQTNGGNTHYTTPNSGSASTNDRTVFGLAQYKNDGSATTGAIVFYAPNTNSTIMHRLRIEGMIYAGGPTVACIIQGYRTTGAWSNTSKINLGITDVQVRLGVDSAGKNCVILGDVGTVWSYPMMAITHAMFSHSGVTDAYCKDWTVGLVTSLTGFTNVTSTIGNSAINSSISGNSATATALQTARTIGGVSFNGTANINLPGVNTAGNQSTSGNAATATILQTTRTINGTNFNGSANITTANWGTARTIWGQSINGSANITAPVLPAAGSVTAPAFSTSGDTNTGIYFSAADTLAVTTGGTLAATFSSGGAFTAVGNVTAYSDIRLKSNIQTLDGKKALQMRGVSYIKDGKPSSGVIAQEIEQIAPELVMTANDEMGTKSVAYGNLVGYLIEALKDQQKQIDDLKAIINGITR